jgi:serine/threonine protein kinase
MSKYNTVKRAMPEVKTIRAREHPNIVKLFASFSAGRLKPWKPGDETNCLHMLFEHTGAGNMRDWLEQKQAPESLIDVSVRRSHIRQTIDSLVHAVAWIHRKIDGDRAYHHDLKPENILLFEEHPATWKICDFGMAKLRRPDDQSGTTRRPNDNGFGTYLYQPPEYFNQDETFRHGRAFDVWSLGCILLELLTIQKYGWDEEGHRTFRDLRAANTDIVSANRRTPRLEPGEDYSYHNNPGVVRDWISTLRHGEEKNTSYLHSLNLVTEMLVDKDQRIFVWEVHIDLYQMANPDLEEQDLQAEFRKVVQASETPINSLSTAHNPLKRAKEHGKDWQEGILVENKWSIEDPDPILKAMRRDTGMHFSTLDVCKSAPAFKRDKLCGRHTIDQMIGNKFRYSSFVGLYGLSGIG